MEHSISSLAFKGSIMEAITEAKQQKKLFVVYLSGDNVESNHLEESTWTDSKVAESVSKYCVLLHIPEASADAANFSAIYPQKSAPCITVIGYTGVQVWQSEGFVAADVLASSLEKYWLSLHIQETTATFLTSALASGTSNTASLEHGSSSTTNEPSPPTNRTESRLTRNPEILAEKHVVEETDSKMSGEASPKFTLPEISESGELEEFASTKTAKESVSSGSVEPKNKESQCANAKENLDSCDKHVVPKIIASRESANEAREAIRLNRNEDVEVERSGVSDSTNKSTDAHLIIRLPDGSSLPVKFSLMDTLAMVKDYVDKNKTSSFGLYDLAIPYPRKVFDDKDLDKQLTELELSNRQALIVVLRQNSRPRGGLSSPNQTNASNHVGSPSASNEGYWAFVRRMLSYANPFSYLSGGPTSSHPTQDNQSGMWQHGPNPARQNDLRGARGPYTASSSNQSTTAASGSSSSKSKQKTPPKWGSNIHTLKHDEEDSRFNDKNAFWNGNSTQYGGGNDGKEE